MAITQTITVLPTPPSRADPANFDTRADAFLGALPTMQTQMNTWAGQANSTASAATGAAGDAEAAQAAAEAAQGTATTQAGIATTQAGIATTQAGIATAQAGTATTQAGTATTQAGIATTQAGIATTQAGTATTQAGIATTQAGTATTKAGEASASAGTATTKAGEAAASAVTATTQAGTATTQAGIATTQAGTATTKAGEASASAGTATTQAGTATTQAGIATTQAGIATTQAGIATTKAGEAAASAALAVDVVSGGLTSTTPAANKIPLADGAAKIALGWLDLTGYAPAAQGVTNGNSHDHNGGDGAQIAYASLSGLPTLGTAAATASSNYAPASHAHGNITAAGAIGSTANLPVITTTSGALTTGAFGTGATNFTAGNDARLSDARTPTAHNQAETTITFTDVSTGNASTTAHGFSPKATAPASGLRSVLAIDNGETVRTDKALFDATNPAALGSAAPGSAMTAARRDHVHALPDGLVTNGNSHDHNGGDGAQIAYSSLSGTPSVRERLTAARHYYVRTDGSDANTGLANTAGGAFLTVQKAVDVAASLDVGLYNVYLSIGSGTYDGVIVLKPYVTGGGQISIEGSATPANHILTNTSSDYGGTVVAAASCGSWRFYGVRISVSATGYKGIDASGLSRIAINSVDFTGGVYAHLYAAGPASIYCEAGYSISGGVSSGNHIDVRAQGIFSGYGTITLTGTPAFAGSFVFADVGGCASFDGISFSGSATGSRYSARAGGIVATFGGATYLPGDSAGSTASGGIYA